MKKQELRRALQAWMKQQHDPLVVGPPEPIWKDAPHKLGAGKPDAAKANAAQE